MAAISTLTEQQISAARNCLHRLLDSPVFARSERQCRFLSFLVSETLAGHADRLKEYTIGIEVFDRPPTFNPSIEAIVRVEAGRLRSKLREYYEVEGKQDAIRFELPKGNYGIHIMLRPGLAQQDISAIQTPQRAVANDSTPKVVPPVEDQPSLAVLPFTNMSSNPEHGYFADGITEGLITELSRISALFVISRHSSFVYKGQTKRAEEIGKELGVKYLLEGSVQRSGERVRISTQLVDAMSGAHIWAERYDRSLEDIFAVQDDVIQRVVAVLHVKLTGAEKMHHGSVRSMNIEAHDCLLRGLERFWAYTRESVEEACAQFKRAVELDPGYAAGHAWLVRALMFQWIMLWRPESAVLEYAYEHARMAVDLDEHQPYGHSVLCWVQLWRGQKEAAIAAGWRAVALDPNNADAYLFLSVALSAAGRGEEALHNIEKGIRLNPHPSTFYQFALGQCHFVLGDYDRAISAFTSGAKLKHEFLPNHLYLCLIYTLLDREEEARVEHDALLVLTEGHRQITQPIWLDEKLLQQDQLLRQRAGLV
jgi:TolB-like protein